MTKRNANPQFNSRSLGIPVATVGSAVLRLDHSLRNSGH